MRLATLVTLIALAGCRSEDKNVDTGTITGDPEPADADGDGYGDASDGGTDCDDGDASVNPAAAETCDGVDNDCDGTIDEDVTSTFYADEDGDGYGDPDASADACGPPDRMVADATDCDDTQAAAHPGAPETCDGFDNDCDGDIDEDDVVTWYADGDGDGFGDPGMSVEDCATVEGYVLDATDCDDTRADANPDAAEDCDAIDNDCDGDVDEDVTTTYYEDRDGDGHGDPAVTQDACALPSGYADDAGDCDDDVDSVSPDASESCDGIDNDCDGDVDEDSAVDAATWYADGDGDGYGDPARSTVSCEAPAGSVANDGDCDDTEPLAWSGAAEACDGVDNDCDGTTDEGVTTTFYADDDGDGYGDDADTTEDCSLPSGYAEDGGDCDDSDADYNPGAAAGCDGNDYDCDGSVDNDSDGDGYADESCGGGDCDDSDATIVPEADGTCAEGVDCLDLYTKGHTTDGTYTIDPDGSGAGAAPFDVTCDMSTDGGGWTLIMHFYEMSGLQEDDFIALYGHNLFTDETWSFDASTGAISDGLSSDGLALLTSQGMVGADVMDGLWDDLRMGCSLSDDDDTESYYAQVDGYATTNGTWDLLGAAANGTAYAVDSALNSSGLTTIYHDNETTTQNSNHYLCDIYDSAYNASYGGAPQFSFCYTDHLNNPNTLDYGDSIVAFAFGTYEGADGWSDGFTGECGAMGTTALQNTGTFSMWVR